MHTRAYACFSLNMSRAASIMYFQSEGFLQEFPGTQTLRLREHNTAAVGDAIFFNEKTLSKVNC